MAPSARKSSIGATRRPKSHVPYRGDDPTVGRKTGISVQPVPRGSDGFEPFEELIGQINEPPRKRMRHSSQEDEEMDDYDDKEDDEDGEMSMDVDSPIQNYSNARPPNTPRTARPIARTSEVDFDQVPSPRSPRPPGSARRTAGPSRLSAPQIPEEDDYDEGGGGSFEVYDNGNAHYGSGSPRQTSFTEMDTREDSDGDEDDEPVPTPKKLSPKKKGKEKAVTPEPEPEKNDSDMEDDIARGMDDVEEDEEPVKSPPKKKGAKAKEKPSKSTTTAIRSKLQKENREAVPEGVRRSSRVHYAPLEWWRNEKVEFGGRDPEGGLILVPRIKAIIRIPKEPVLPLGKHGRAARKRSRTPAMDGKGKGKERVKIVEKIVEVPVEGAGANPEEGWDDETETQAVVKEYPTDKDVTRRIAFTARMFAPTPAANNEWFFQKIFGDGDFIAAGQIVIPPKGRKPSKRSKDNTFIFLVVEGAVNLKVCDTSLIIASGGMFMIPRGNTYFIENIAERDAKLFFTQARKMREGEDDVEKPDGDAEAADAEAAGVESDRDAKRGFGGARAVSSDPRGVDRKGKDKGKEVLRRGMSANV
ncbi:Mif2/CENP-C like-domain-containing protein [Mycena galopus ATCC 62051]|nr:Mif2/CENP-C like-domain-containing protein [Mycena galopus ATCC 62051]